MMIFIQPSFASDWIFSCVGLDSLYRLLNWQALIEKKKEASRQHQGSRNGKLFESQNNIEKIQTFTIPRFFLQTTGASLNHYRSSSWVKPWWQLIRWVVAQLSEQPVIAWIGLQILKEVVLQECFPGLDPSSWHLLWWFMLILYHFPKISRIIMYDSLGSWCWWFEDAMPEVGIGHVLLSSFSYFWLMSERIMLCPRDRQYIKLVQKDDDLINLGQWCESCVGFR